MDEKFYLCEKIVAMLKYSILFFSIIMWFDVSHASSTSKYKMKILYIVEKFPFYTKTIILNQAISLLELGHDVFIYSCQKKISDKLDPEIFEYKIIDRVYYSMPPDLNTYDIIVFQYGNLAKDFIKIKEVFGLKAKLVTFFRGGDITKDMFMNNDYYKEVFKMGDLFLPICRYFKYKLISLGCDPKKIFVSYSPINCDRFKYKKRPVYTGEKVTILSINRLHESKGTNFVINAMRSLIKKYPFIEYIIAGDGPEKENLQNLIKRNGLEKNVKLLGWCSQEEVVKLLDKAHIFILFSVTSRAGTQEAIPNVIKEAMLKGLPIVTTYHGGITELVKNGVNGFLVPERDVNALTDVLSHLLENRSVWPIIGSKGRNLVKQTFDMWKLGAVLEQRFYECLGII